MDDDYLKSIEKSAIEIFDKAKRRENVGKGAFEAGWQATLETMLLVVEKNIVKQPGQLLAMQIENQEEWEFYLNIKGKLDLPPETSALLVTPSAFKSIPAIENVEMEHFWPKAWERNAYSLIVSDLKDHEKIMQASLPGIEHAGIDVFDDGNHLSDYSYNTIEECIDELTKTAWIHFNPKEKWTDELIVRYTENWLAKSLEIDLQNTEMHEEFSYLHHPELLKLTPYEAVFKAVGEIIPKGVESIQEFVDTTNELNRDFEFDKPTITTNGILNDNESECRILLERIHLETDMSLESLEDIKGVNFPLKNRTGVEYQKLFDETTFKIYEAITGRPYPK